MISNGISVITILIFLITWIITYKIWIKAYKQQEPFIFHIVGTLIFLLPVLLGTILSLQMFIRNMDIYKLPLLVFVIVLLTLTILLIYRVIQLIKYCDNIDIKVRNYIYKFWKN